MNRSCLPVRAGGTEYRLRLTMAGQRALRERWGEDILPFLLSAAAEPEKLCDLLTQALSWTGSENPTADGAELYDLLVDEGWRGQEDFAALAFDLGVASGLLKRSQADELIETVKKAFQSAFDALAER